jgi:hypothetical protein
LEVILGVYDNRSRRGRNADQHRIITDNLTSFVRQRKVFEDKLRVSTTEEIGPFACRIEAFRATRSATVFDEKGSTASAAYVLIALNDDTLGATWEIPTTAGTFVVDDTIVDGSGNIYRVTSPARWDGNVLELNIELQG